MGVHLREKWLLSTPRAEAEARTRKIKLNHLFYIKFTYIKKNIKMKEIFALTLIILFSLCPAFALRSFRPSPRCSHSLSASSSYPGDFTSKKSYGGLWTPSMGWSMAVSLLFCVFSMPLKCVECFRTACCIHESTPNVFNQIHIHTQHLHLRIGP